MRSSLPATAAAVTATAVVGTLGTDVRSRWYLQLDKPSWQPPGPGLRPRLDHPLRAPLGGLGPRSRPGPHRR